MTGRWIGRAIVTDVVNATDVVIGDFFAVVSPINADHYGHNEGQKKAAS